MEAICIRDFGKAIKLKMKEKGLKLVGTIVTVPLHYLTIHVLQLCSEDYVIC